MFLQYWHVLLANDTGLYGNVDLPERRLHARLQRRYTTLEKVYIVNDRAYLRVNRKFLRAVLNEALSASHFRDNLPVRAREISLHVLYVRITEPSRAHSRSCNRDAASVLSYEMVVSRKTD